ncbi:hypothetical protein Agub_g9514 [Astrephomene gubernaculifera]|uniref:Uncharacterized protein n=1 Tax=Astrephomene gubernaculifera TaxID=47775 RepID=A0AAD3HNB7_9CHLO|nr:hypothetical protein Agub_g9514 [Astrephomene gubernaculifera]
MLHHYSASKAALFGRRAICCRRVVQIGNRVAALSTDTGNTGHANSSSDAVHVTIVGGGAAGLTAAFFAAEHGAKVTVLERTREAGKKILMSGGSRCNVLPLEVDLSADYHSDSAPSAVRAVFASWNLEACRAWLEDPYWGVGVDLQLEEETKKYFPSSNSSREVRDKLVAACLARGVTFRYDASVEALQPLLQSPPPPPLHEEQQQQQEQQQQEQQQQGLTQLQLQGQGQQQGTGQGQHPLGAVVDGDGDRADMAVRQHQLGSGGEAAGPSHSRDGSQGSSSSSTNSGGAVAKRGKKARRGPRENPVAAAASDAVAAAAAPAAGATTRWLCRLRDGSEHVTDKLIIATGGLSFPAVGTDGTGHRMLQALGHRLSEPYPALTPLKGPHPAGQQLAGVSMYDIELSVQLPGSKRPKVSERTALLFTHKGYSGPAVLDLSHFAVRGLERGGGDSEGHVAVAQQKESSQQPISAQQHSRQAKQQVVKQTVAAAASLAESSGGGNSNSSSSSTSGNGNSNSSSGGSGNSTSGNGNGNSSSGGSGSSTSGNGNSNSSSGSSSSGSSSGYLSRGLPSIRVNWTREPAAVWDERIRSGGTLLVSTLLQRHGLRERLAEALVTEAGLLGTRVCDVRKSQRAQLVSLLTSYELPYSGHEGYKKAEVTGGGVRLEELDCATLESRLLPGLFLCGECVDVFGRIGGFNFYWAWVSGRLAGVGAAQGGLHPRTSSAGRNTRKTTTTYQTQAATVTPAVGAAAAV